MEEQERVEEHQRCKRTKLELNIGEFNIAQPTGEQFTLVCEVWTEESKSFIFSNWQLKCTGCGCQIKVCTGNVSNPTRPHGWSIKVVIDVLNYLSEICIWLVVVFFFCQRHLCLKCSWHVCHPPGLGFESCFLCARSLYILRVFWFLPPV